jgi:hypothetical protein
VYASRPAIAQEESQDPFYYYGQAMQAYQAKDYSLFLQKLNKFITPDTKHPYFIYMMASAHALVEDNKKSLEWLTKLADMGLSYPIGSLNDFAGIKNSEEFKTALQAFEKNSQPVRTSTVAYTLAEKDLIPEGVAYDAKGKKLYVGSIHKRKILSIDARGVVKDFITEGQDGLFGVLGMKVDPVQQVLWVCSIADVKDKELNGSSAIFKFNLTNGTLIKKYFLSGNLQQKQLLNDVDIHPNGDLFITNSEAGAIYTIPVKSDSLQVFVAPKTFIYPNGLTLSPDGNRLYVADFNGISIIDIATKAIATLGFPQNTTTAMIDGLYFYKNSLIAVQNGVKPERIIRLHLNQAQNSVERLQVLEANNPAFIIPTTGAIAGDSFYYIANSQLRGLKEDGTILPPDQLKEILIMKTSLQK